MVADGLTKALPPARWRNFILQLGLVKQSALEKPPERPDQVNSIAYSPEAPS